MYIKLTKENSSPLRLKSRLYYREIRWKESDKEKHLGIHVLWVLNFQLGNGPVREKNIVDWRQLKCAQ